MTPQPHHTDGSALAAPALRMFFRLSDEWELSFEECRALLGVSDEANIMRWRRGEAVGVMPEVIQRIAMVLSIYKALHILFPVALQANGWIKSPNKEPLFAGQAALEVMAQPDLSGLHAVLRYLESQGLDPGAGA